MKKFPFLLLISIFCCLNIFADDYNLPSGDGDKGSKTVTNSLTFYDNGGSNGDASKYCGTKICFEPTTPGQQLSIKFSELNIDPDNATIYIYDGDCQYTTWNTVPEGYMAALKTGDVGANYQTTNVDGKMAIFYLHTKSSVENYDGWVATVSEFTPEPMTYVGASVEQSMISDSYPGKKNTVLALLKVETNSSLNPLDVTAITYDLAGTTSLSDIDSLRLYRTSTDQFNANDLVETVAATQVAGAFYAVSTLSPANNYYWITCDVSASAVAENKIDVSVASIAVGGDTKTVVTSDMSKSVLINNVIVMSSGYTSYNVSSLPYTLYDDGGEEGSISEGFDGCVTFRPTSVGKKIKLEFISVDLFNTSSTGMNDILNIYQGDTIDIDNYFMTVLKETSIIHSTAADGSLTLSLTSTTGIPKSGFVARVSEFIPEPMTINSTEVIAADTATIASGADGVKMLRININTLNTEPAQVLSALNLNTTAASYIDNVKAYYTGMDSTFSISELIGTAVPANDYILTLSSPITLREGDNFIWVTYDMKTGISNGTTISLGLKDFTSNGNVNVVDNGTPSEDRVVLNKYVSSIASNVVDVNGTWIYTHNDNGFGKYVAETGNQQVTFRPTTESHIIEVEYNFFEIAYSLTSYGVKAKYEIYSGEGTDGPLLWSVNDAEKGANGPESIIRSTSEDGSLTFVFNANDNSSYYAKRGWNAEVREYMSKPMEVDSVYAFQNESDIIKADDKDVEIIGFNVIAQGDMNAINFNSVSVNLKQSLSCVDSVSLFYTAKKDEFSTAVSVVKVAATADVTLTAPASFSLTEGDNYFWVAYDIKEVIEAEKSIDASITAVSVGTSSPAIMNSDPDGERITKNIVNMGIDVTDTVVVASLIMFYDNGGKDVQYDKEEGVVVFKPATEGKVIKAVIREFKSYFGDDLLVYNGMSTDDEEIGEYNGTSMSSELPITLIGSSDNGALTFQFDPSSYGSTNEGWEIEITEYTPLPLTQGAIDVQIFEDDLFKGASHVAFRLNNRVVGDKGSFNMADLTVDFSANTSMANIDSVELFFTDTVSAFAPINRALGTISGQTATFDVNNIVSKPGVYKYWVRLNIAATANVGDSIVSIMNGTVNKATIADGFSGTYVIGSSDTADYVDFTSAIAALNAGVDAPVVFNIEAGTYTETIVVNAIKGVSPINTVTFQTLSGNKDVIINYTSTEENETYGVITINGGDYVTIKNLKVTSTNVLNPIVWVKNSSSYVTLDGLDLTAPYVDGYSGKPYCVYVEGEDKAYQNSDFFTLKNSKLKGSRMGVNVNGTGYISLPKQVGARIINNTFEGQGSMGIYAQQEMDIEISGNTITNTVSQATNFKAIDFVAMPGAVVKNNRINLSTENYASGMYIRNGARYMSLTSTPAHIFNNEVVFAEISGSSSSYGIQCTDPLVNTHIAYNSVVMNASSEKANSYVFYLNTTATKPCVSSSIKHNIFQNNAHGIAIRTNSNAYFTDGNLTLANNMYYTNGDVFANVGTTAYATFAEWTTVTTEQNSANVKVQFLSANVLDLNSDSALIEQSTEDFATTDILARSRGEKTYPGAYEYSVVVEDAPSMDNAYPAFTDILHNEATMQVKTDVNAYIQVVVAAASDVAPTLDSLQSTSQIEIAANTETDVAITELKPLTVYKAYYVLSTLRGSMSEVFVSDEFTTSYKPTEVSTFENVDSTNIGTYAFQDGTALFRLFEVVVDSSALGENNIRVAKAVNTSACVSVTNTPDDISLDGFYLKSSGDVTIKTIRTDSTFTSKTVNTNEEWTFINLRDAGEIHHVEFIYADGVDIFIDNFSGEPQTLDALMSDVNAHENEDFTFEYLIAGGVEPYTLEWFDASQQLLSSDANATLRSAFTDDFYLHITDAWGNEVEASATVYIKGEQQIADFENLYLDSESHRPGNWTADEDLMDHFYSGSFHFNTYVYSEWSSWSFFGYSNETSTDYTTFEDQYRSVVGHGANGSENYGISYVSSMFGNTIMKPTNSADGDTIPGMYITNTSWTADVILNGDGITSGDNGFTSGDSLILTVIGMYDGTATENGRLSVPLADFRNSDSAEHYYHNTWQWVDLSSLGNVDEVRFEISGSKNGPCGLNTPSYFAIDNVGAPRPERTVETQEIGNNTTVALASLITFNSADAPVHYNVIERTDNVNIATITDGILSIVIEGDEAEILVEVYQKGKREYIRIPIVKITTSVDNASQELVNVWSKNGILSTECSADAYEVEIYAVTGICLVSDKNVQGLNTYNIGNENKVVVVRIKTAKSTTIHRVIL